MILPFARLITVFLLLVISLPASALTDQQEVEIARIGSLSVEELAGLVESRLQEKYPREDWDDHRFPHYVYTSKPVEIAYKVATKKPELIREVKCLCYCEDAKGHENLLYCFYKGGVVRGSFDPHAVGCSLCYTQTLLAFMWSEIGVPDEEINEIMTKK
jgi:hypothetical protein